MRKVEETEKVSRQPDESTIDYLRRRKHIYHLQQELDYLIGQASFVPQSTFTFIGQRFEQGHYVSHVPETTSSSACSKCRGVSSDGRNDTPLLRLTPPSPIVDDSTPPADQFISIIDECCNSTCHGSVWLRQLKDWQEECRQEKFPDDEPSIESCTITADKARF